MSAEEENKVDETKASRSVYHSKFVVRRQEEPSGL